MKELPVSFSGSAGLLSGVLHVPEHQDSAIVIASHGLLSSKNSEKFVELGMRLAALGITTLRFDYTGCGESEGELKDTTVSGRLSDLESALDWVRTRRLSGNRKIGLMGSSLGGFLSLLAAARHSDVHAVVSWATPYTISDRRKKPPVEGVPVLSPEFFEDLKQYNLLSEISRLERVMIVHGEYDELVPGDHARALYDALSEPRRLEIIAGGDHRLSDPALRRKAYEFTEGWFQDHLLIRTSSRSP